MIWVVLLQQTYFFDSLKFNIATVSTCPVQGLGTCREHDWQAKVGSSRSVDMSRMQTYFLTNLFKGLCRLASVVARSPASRSGLMILFINEFLLR